MNNNLHIFIGRTAISQRQSRIGRIRREMWCLGKIINSWRDCEKLELTSSWILPSATHISFRDIRMSERRSRALDTEDLWQLSWIPSRTLQHHNDHVNWGDPGTCKGIVTKSEAQGRVDRNYINSKAKNSPYYKHAFQRTKWLRPCSVENLDPGGSKSKIFEIQRNWPKMGYGRYCEKKRWMQTDTTVWGYPI